jgi:hypothetical protein
MEEGCTSGVAWWVSGEAYGAGGVVKVSPVVGEGADDRRGRAIKMIAYAIPGELS